MKKLEQVIILAFNPPWLPMIESGEKKYEFRDRIGNDWKPGMRVLLAITKNGGGSGLIEAEFTIGNIFDLYFDRIDFIDSFVNNNIVGTQQAALTLIKTLGYNGQNYAIEITNFKKYDKPIELRKLYHWTNLHRDFEFTARELAAYDGVIRTRKEKVLFIKEEVMRIKKLFVISQHKGTMYNPCRHGRMPQSWAYGGVIVNE